MKLSKKGQSLIKLYNAMATEGYDRTDGAYITDAFSDFESRAYRKIIKKILTQNHVKTVLDYGCGGSNWNLPGFDSETGQSAEEYYQLNHAYHYEPARNTDERTLVDCVISFDVLEHVFISDIPNTIREIFSLAKKIVIINVACYPAAAKLPNGENAHITVRHPAWWKGMFDAIVPEFPDIEILLFASTGYRKTDNFEIYSGKRWLDDPKFEITY
jgi:hypothetical protein